MNLSSNEDVVIRPMRHDDVAAATLILNQWNMAPVHDQPDAERSTIDVECSFVAERGGTVVGTASYIMLGGGVAETASLAVDPAVKGLGIGYRLQATRLEAMWRKGARCVRTETDRPATVRWYIDRFGYQRVGTNPKKHSFSMPEADEWIVLELDLESWASSHGLTQDPANSVDGNSQVSS